MEGGLETGGRGPRGVEGREGNLCLQICYVQAANHRDDAEQQS